MTFLDIHAHILPAVDDGAKDIETAIALLEMLKQQGVTDVIATPHFYPDTDNYEDFSEITTKAFYELKKEVEIKNLPNIYLGCELRYFNGMGNSSAIKQFVIKGTNYLLLELPYGETITKTILQDIININERFGIIPILAHIERYSKAKGYKELLRVISDGYALAHINGDGLLSKETSRCCAKLIKGGYVSFLASDTHSINRRPPKIKDALEFIENKFGKSTANRLIIKSNSLLQEIEVGNE